MARTAEKVESLVEEDPAFLDALAVVRREQDEDGEVEWSDVQDDVTDGQWGRLIQTGVLESADDGFRIADDDAVAEVLDDEVTVETTEVPDDDESSWSQWDKIAGVATLGMMAGYYVTPIRDVVAGAIDLFLAPLDALLPFYVVILAVAMLTGLYSTLLQANLMDMDKMGAYQERMKAIQERKKQAKERGDDEALERVKEEQMEAMGDQLGMFKEQFRPMVWITLLTIPIFLWMYWRMGTAYTGDTVILPMAGQVGWNEGLLGPMPAWIVWYFLCSMGFSQLIRKSLNLQTTPST